MRRLVLLFILFLPLAVRAEEPKALGRIGFGSCVHQDKPQPIWDTIAAYKPDLFLMLGDAIYADVPKGTKMEEAYAKLAAQSGFVKLRQTCPMLAVWDDHDYGLNDAGAEFPNKDESKKQFLTFFGEPPGSPRWQRPGVYDAKIIGPPGRRVQIILLDGRYNRSPLKKGRRGSDPDFPFVEPYVPNTDADATMLGPEQWKWFEEQLKQLAEVRLVCCGIQIISDEHIFEKWANFPRERERLFRLLRDTKAAGVILLTGDRHFADLSVIDAGLGYSLYDLTASGFNQASADYRPPEKNRHRVAAMSWGNHFGCVEIDWDKPDALIRLQIRDETGDLAFQHKVPLSALQPKGLKAAQPVGPGAISTAEAAKKIGEKVTVELTVNSTGGNVKKRLFLNSEKNFRSKENFTIVLDMAAAGEKFTAAKVDDPAKHYGGKTIRVTGTVSEYQGRSEMIVTDPGQIEVAIK
jgi:alkaline phosphatase D